MQGKPKEMNKTEIKEEHKNSSIENKNLTTILAINQ